jgi:hypothetical protein
MKATLRCFTNALDDEPSAVHTFDGLPRVVAEQFWLTLSTGTQRAIEFDFEANVDEQLEFDAAYQALVPDCTHADHGWAGTDVTE